MPRRSRVVIPNCPHHIVQTGHNRQVVFLADNDYEFYLETLNEWRQSNEIRVYAWCLMKNQIHLIVEPPDDVSQLGQLMKRLSGRQTRYMNRIEDRSGTLWESRYKSSPIQADQYLLACIRYIELIPVATRAVKHAEEYQWSSYNARIKGQGHMTPDLDPCFLALGDNHAKRTLFYQDYVKSDIPAGEWAFIKEAVARGQLTGNRQFIEHVETITGRRIEHRRPGRPISNKTDQYS
ncbi:MAG: transposase [Gammaproteobacteria bacterium]|nr:transposase [Gammaproteobacteria bacterium]